MKIGFVGAGKVGFSLGKYFKLHQLNVVGYYSKNPKSACEAAKFTNTKSFSSLETLIKNSDMIFLTVQDGNIEAVWEEINTFNFQNKIFCHCSGAMTSTVFQKGNHKNYGYSIHPMYAFNDKHTSYKDLSKIFFTIEGDKEHINDVNSLIEDLGNPVKIISKDNKIKYHGACVFVSNLVVSLFDQGTELLSETGFSKEEAVSALMPLFINNAMNIYKYGPVNALTGPIERNDLSTVDKHLNVMEDGVRDIYIRLSKELINVAEEKDPKKDYSKMKKILGDKNDEKHSNNI